MWNYIRTSSAVFSGGAGGARATLEFRGSQKGRSLISAYQSFNYYYEHPRIWKAKYGSDFKQIQLMCQVAKNYPNKNVSEEIM